MTVRRALLGRALIPVLVGAVIVALNGCALGGCDDQGPCGDAIVVEHPPSRLPSAGIYSLRACVDGRCGTERTDYLDPEGFAIGVPVPEEDVVSVSYRVTDSKGRSVLEAYGSGRVRRERSNECTPECRVVRARLEGDRLVPIEDG